MNRLDIELVKRGIFTGRDRAHEEIKKGLIKVDGLIETKASKKVEESSLIEYLGSENKSTRAELKLKEAFNTFQLDVRGKDVIDIGASTGGFTRVLLDNGAKSVTALDVGHGQLMEDLKEDSRVINKEGYNFKLAKEEDFPFKYDFFTMDVSFISVRKLILSLLKVIKNRALGLVLIKPQFELKKSALNSKGVVRDGQYRKEALEKVIGLFLSYSFKVVDLIISPILGSNGNIEYLLYLEFDLDEDKEIRDKLTIYEVDMEAIKDNCNEENKLIYLISKDLKQKIIDLSKISQGDFNP